MKNQFERENLKLKYSTCDLPTQKKRWKCPGSLAVSDDDDPSYEEKKKKKLVQYYKLQRLIFSKGACIKTNIKFLNFLS